MRESARPYLDPYLAGVGIGLVLLAAYALAGRGLGASGAFASVVAAATDDGPSPFTDWLFLEMLGVLAGAFLSARLTGRWQRGLDTGTLRPTGRILAAGAGGVLIGFGARLAHGCTSGLALTGGALLAVSGWVFIGSCFAAAYLCAPFTRRLWS